METLEFNNITQKLTNFFENKNFLRVDTQSKRTILAACEDPRTVTTYKIGGESWPLPQTGQMILEEELLKNPKIQGVYCETTSYRDEPVNTYEEGRHLRVFPMFEFESLGDMNSLRELEKQLLTFLGFGKICQIHHQYASDLFVAESLDSEHESLLSKDYGPVISLENFPECTSPFFNMKRNGRYANKIDILLHGMETIGSAERETNPETMRNRFHTISDGKYSAKLYELFGKERVNKELENYLSFPMIERFGGGIGMDRLIRAMKLEGILDCKKNVE